MANQIVISRIQHRRGIRENLPQPLLPGELALTVDTGELWIGQDPNQPPWGVRTYGSGAGDISSAEAIVDTQIVAATFSPAITQSTFESLVAYLITTPTPAVVLIDTDILWDGGTNVFVAADTSIDVANTISNIVTAIDNSPVGNATGTGEFVNTLANDELGSINDPTQAPGATSAFDTDGQFLLGSGNAAMGANAARLINQIHGAQLVTTLSNLQVTTSGIGVGSSTFRDMTVTDTDTGFTWLDIGTASADSVTDELTWVSGEGIDIQVDPTLDAIRITNTIDSVSATPYTLTLSTAAFTDVPGLVFDMEAPGTDISDAIILEYSINIGGAVAGVNNYTAIGTMMIVGNILAGVANAGIATLTDNQVEVRYPGLAGAVNFQAVFSAGTGTGGADETKIQYTNTFTTNVSLRVLKRRWSSF